MQRRHFLQGLGALAMLGMAPALARVTPAKPLYFDGLSFLPEDLNDIRASKLDGYICDISAIEEVKQPDGSVNYKRTYNACMKSIKAALERVQDNPGLLRLGRTAADLEQARSNHQCALYFQIQGADCVEERLDQVDEFHDLGLRVLQLTHHYGNRYAGGALDKDAKGLSRDGLALIELLNARNMLIDLSHSAVPTALDAIRASKAPVVQSHGACRAIVNNARCSPDQVIRAIADSGGVFGVFMMSFWLTNDAVPGTEHFIAQLRHVAKVGGMDAVAIANDYPLRGQKNLLALGNDNAEGVKQYLDWWRMQGQRGILGFDREPVHVVIPELNHIERFERIDQALARAGFKGGERERILGGNWQRVLGQVLV
ncbi:membrane dipeptidase [Gallaecimonas sp. GXIMD4217]|uniref:membrane dipeptidase n=1 Tax=Gallaecimonas sp. GXIMD4217 TaxID=3131927 RepID=UPI00311B15FB